MNDNIKEFNYCEKNKIFFCLREKYIIVYNQNFN